MEKQPFYLGDFEIHWLQGGNFRLDGGTMFGPVPKVIWEKQCQADEKNLISLCNDPLLIRTPDHNIVIDTGLGNKLTDKQKKIFQVAPEWKLPQALHDLGLDRSEIDFVILTHCDFDHAGGIVMHNDAKEEELTFANGMHLIHEQEWQDVEHPCRRAMSTYWPENFAQLKKRGKFVLTKETYEVCPGVRLCHTGGHTRGHQLVELSSKGEWAVHLGDLFPDHLHSNPLWVMAYDNFPLEVIDCKERYFADYGKRDAWFFFYHDMDMRACKMGPKGEILKQW